MQKEEMGQEPIFIQMFRKAEPFYQGRCAGAEPYRKLEEEYAYWDTAGGQGTAGTPARFHGGIPGLSLLCPGNRRNAYMAWG